VTRSLSDEDKSKMRLNWQNYIGYAKTYFDPKSVHPA